MAPLEDGNAVHGRNQHVWIFLDFLAAAKAFSAAAWSACATNSTCPPQVRPRRRTRQPPPVKLLPGGACCRKVRSRDTCARAGGYACPAAQVHGAGAIITSSRRAKGAEHSGVKRVWQARE